MARSKGLRKYRGSLDMSRTIMAGPASCRSIVYGYGFPSQPGKIKIGYSSRGLDRVMEQSTSFPEKPIVHFCIRHPQAKDLEAAFHQTLAHAQTDTVGVEWFNVSLEEVIQVSPELRAALGLKSRFAWLRRGFSALGLLIGLALTPMTYPISVALIGGPSSGITIATALDIAGHYGKFVAGLHVGDVLRLVRQMIGAMLAGTHPFSATVVALVPALVIAGLPMMMGTRQARV